MITFDLRLESATRPSNDIIFLYDIILDIIINYIPSLCANWWRASSFMRLHLATHPVHAHLLVHISALDCG